MGRKGVYVIKTYNKQKKRICPLLPNSNQITYNNEKLFITFDVFFGEWRRYRLELIEIRRNL
jgi:hypothetical protein